MGSFGWVVFGLVLGPLILTLLLLSYQANLIGKPSLLGFSTVCMEDFCGQLMPNPDQHGIISFTYDPKNITLHNCTVVMRAGWMGLGYDAEGFLLVFQEVSLFDPNCDRTSINVEQYDGNPMHGNYDLENFGHPSNNHGILGIPIPLCQNNIPWSSYPSEMIPTEGFYLKITFRGTAFTSSKTSFKLMYTNFYTNSRKCGPDEYRCNNDRCIPRIAHNGCDGIDWCGDGSGCGLSSTDAVLIGSICAGVGCAILGIIIGICIGRYKKAKLRRETEARLDYLTRDINTWRNFDQFLEPRNTRSSAGAQVPSTAPIRSLELEQIDNRDIPYVVPENDISETRAPFNSIENNMRRNHEVPPPSYEAVIAAEAKKDPEEPLPSYKEVAENPTEFHPYATTV